MKQRLFILTILVIGISVIAEAQKEEFKESVGVKGGHGVYWEKKDGVLIISGHGRMPDFNNEQCQPWSFQERYSDNRIKKVIIEEGVTSIGTCAFYGCSNLIDIEIPSSVSSIRPYAFKNCTSLPYIQIPNSIKVLGTSIFDGCSSLTSVVIPSPVSFDDSNCGGTGCNVIEGTFDGYKGSIQLAIEGLNNSIYYLVRKKGLWGLNDYEGKEIVSPELSLLEPAGKGFLRFIIDCYYGIMNYTGKIIIPNSRCYTYIGDYKSLTKRFTYSMNGLVNAIN